MLFRSCVGAAAAAAAVAAVEYGVAAGFGYGAAGREVDDFEWFVERESDGL